MAEWAVEKLSEEVERRVHPENKSGKRKGRKKFGEGDTPEDHGDVVVLDAENFGSMVLQSKDLWFVEFYASWCDHCKTLAPRWKKLATAMKGKVKLGKVDADEHKSIADRYKASSYPTLQVFGRGL